MDSGKVGDWVQIVGTFGVIASLIFVGLQMQQTQEIALASTYNARAGQAVDAMASVHGTPQYLSGIAKIYSGLREELTAEEYVALEQSTIMNLTMLENNHFQYRMGYLPEEHWQKNLRDIDCRMSEPFFAELAEFWVARDSFKDVLLESIERGRQAGTSCWENTADDPWGYFNPVE